MQRRLCRRLTFIILITLSIGQIAAAPGIPVPVDVEYDSRDVSIADYQATGSITFGEGFATADGDSFVAEIVPATFGVPQATSLTGTADATINWIQSTAFDESGNVIGDAKQFFDESGRKTQSQKKTFYQAGATTVYTHVLASQTIKDAFGRDAATTMQAPIDYADFSYRSNFLQHNPSGNPYNHQNFDLSSGGDKTNNPDPLWDASSGTPAQGTLAWYYSKNNNWEPYAGETSYPFSRQTFYQDGTGNRKKAAEVGDQLRMGLSREESTCVTPVANELDFYLQVRNKFFTTAEIGALPTGIQNQAIQMINRDGNGRDLVQIQDRSGKTLMTARAGTGITVTNSVAIAPAGLSDQNIWYFRLLSAGPVTVTGTGFTLYDMNTEQPVPGFNSGNTLQVGYYKLSNTGTASVTLSYTNSYSDVSYNFYNQKNQLVASIAPEGVKKLYGVNGAGLGSYSTRDNIPYISQLGYDVQGRMISSKDLDKGAVLSVYRKDGKVRFSQNAFQAASGTYSYSNYDQSGRVIEGGQYKPDPATGIPFGSAAMTSILENTDPTGGLTAGTKTDVVVTQYDLPDQSHPLTTYVQDPFTLAGRVSVTRKYSTVANNSPASSNMVSAKWYNYDLNGRIIWQIQYVSGLGASTTDALSYKKTEFTYDVLGNMTKKAFQSGQPDAFTYIYDYDHARGKIWHVYTSAGTASPILQATYCYNLDGSIRRVELGGGLQGIDYTYTLQGAIKAINNSDKTRDPGQDGSGNGFFADGYGEVLDYYTGDYVNTKPQIAVVKGVNASSIASDSYTGDIKAMSWYTEKPSSTGLSDAPNVYAYQYDTKSQLTKGVWGTNVDFGATPANFTTTTFNQEQIGNSGTPAYDGNGNIQYLQRTNAQGTVTDAFSYQYGTNNNQLTTVTNTQNSQPYSSYQYNEWGNVKTQTQSDGTTFNISYDVMGKVAGLSRAAGNIPVVSFAYDETGRRIRKLTYNSTGQLIQVTFYIGDVVYVQTVSGSSYGPVVAQEYQIRGATRIGIYYPQGPIYAYELTDHNGTVRAVIAQNAGTLEVRAYTDYYPYGLVISQGGTNDYRYGYQGQNAEKDPETGWNAFELRMYDSRIGRWLQYDPKGQFYSPYVGMGNNPVTGTDKDGGETDGDDGEESTAAATPDDIIFKNLKGQEIGRIITQTPDKIVTVATDITLPTPLRLDPSKIPNLLKFDVVGIGFEASATYIGGANAGFEFVYFLNGVDAGNIYSYVKGGVNVGLEATLGGYTFLGKWLGNRSEFNASKWEGWFNSYGGGAGALGGSLFWANSRNWPELIPNTWGGKPTWWGFTFGATLPTTNPFPQVKAGAKWSATYYALVNDLPVYQVGWPSK